MTWASVHSAITTPQQKQTIRHRWRAPGAKKAGKRQLFHSTAASDQTSERAREGSACTEPTHGGRQAGISLSLSLSFSLSLLQPKHEQQRATNKNADDQGQHQPHTNATPTTTDNHHQHHDQHHLPGTTTTNNPPTPTTTHITTPNTHQHPPRPTPTYVQERPAQKFGQGGGLIGQGGSFGRQALLFFKRHRNGWWSRVNAPADLESPKGSGLG